MNAKKYIPVIVFAFTLMGISCYKLGKSHGMVDGYKMGRGYDCQQDIKALSVLTDSLKKTQVVVNNHLQRLKVPDSLRWENVWNDNFVYYCVEDRAISMQPLYDELPLNLKVAFAREFRKSVERAKAKYYDKAIIERESAKSCEFRNEKRRKEKALFDSLEYLQYQDSLGYQLTDSQYKALDIHKKQKAWNKTADSILRLPLNALRK